jgi:DMSO/TMAO reductase YedYZ molybdopterin-dependent catalytic subunit
VTRASYKWRLKWPGDGGQLRLSRRALLAAAFASTLTAQEVSSFDFSLLEEGTTPNELFFIREHFPAPAVSSAGWSLDISGLVDTPVRMTFEDLAAQPPKTLPVTLECAENPAEAGLVSHAEWSGLSLSSLLEKARPGADGRFVRLLGADGYFRTLPLAKATHPDTLIVYRMNGEKLPVNHGFPLRAIVPGWYGMDSVKWLRAVEVTTAEAPEQEYVRRVRSLLTGTRPAGPVTAMNIKSTFSRPTDGAVLTKGRRFIVRGAAWAGENLVRQVEVSYDGGTSWRTARLLSEPRRYAWVHWSSDWTMGRAGTYDLSVRAADDKGRVQPAERPSDRVDPYELNACQTIRVTVT